MKSKKSSDVDNKRTKKNSWKRFRNSYQLYLMLALPLIHLLLFRYKPMTGVVVAFKKFNMFKGIWESNWVGLANFEKAFSSAEFWLALKNTLVLNIGDLLIGFPIPIILAIFLNELTNKKVNKSVQLILYLPYFFSWVIIAGIIQQLLSGNGLINNLLSIINMGPVNWLSDPTSWRFVYWFAGVWQGAGYGLIVYYAALTSADASLNEAAYIDGAGRYKRIWYVTLPQIRGTIVMMLILSLGGIVSIGFDRPYLLGNVLVKDASNVISTYVFQVGLKAGKFDFATAVGLFQSVVGVVLLFVVNAIVNKLGEDGVV